MPLPMITGPYPTFRPLGPDKTYLEYEGSTITIPLTAKKDGRTLSEEVQLRAFMRLELEPPYLNNIGTREFQFTIRDWELHGTCAVLNELFFNDPRGHFHVHEGRADYIPATMTFRVSNHVLPRFEIPRDTILPGPTPRPGPVTDPIFGDPRNIEIKNLNSHAFRVWDTITESDGNKWVYSSPNNKIYFQLLPLKRLIDARVHNILPPRILGALATVTPESPLLIFHKKPPGLVGERDFNILEARDRARYLLAISDFAVEGQSQTPHGPLSVMRAVLPDRGASVNIARSQSNTPLSTNSREADALEIRWTAPADVAGPGPTGQLMARVLTDAKLESLTGYLQVVSPARSICTALQAPDLGRPIDSADFPANIHYSINFHVYVNQVRMVEDAAGVAHAYGIHRIPPRDVTVAFDKTHVGTVLARQLMLGKGHCTGMHTISREEFRDGQNYCRYWQSVPLRIDRLGQPDDPWRNYREYDRTVDYWSRS